MPSSSYVMSLCRIAARMMIWILLVGSSLALCGYVALFWLGALVANWKGYPLDVSSKALIAIYIIQSAGIIAAKLGAAWLPWAFSASSIRVLNWAGGSALALALCLLCSPLTKLSGCR